MEVFGLDVGQVVRIRQHNKSLLGHEDEEEGRVEHYACDKQNCADLVGVEAAESGLEPRELNHAVDGQHDLDDAGVEVAHVHDWYFEEAPEVGADLGVGPVDVTASVAYERDAEYEVHH